MSWDRILEIDPGEHVPLRQRIEILFDQQRQAWPALRDGEASLLRLQRKTLQRAGGSIILQLNPARRRSTQAETDARSVAARACFLCPANMPVQERGIAFEDLVLLPNPFPVLPMHATLACRQHRPQQFAGEATKFLRLTQAIGADFAALYNGPRCGASAPDHFHFQCALAESMPIWTQLPCEGNEVLAFTSFGRHIVVVRGNNLERVGDCLAQVIAAIPRATDDLAEPKFNLAARFENGRFTALVFPRAAHRPACYFDMGPERIAISPAVLEMCGILVVTEQSDFHRIKATTAQDVYTEVSLPALSGLTDVVLPNNESRPSKNPM